MKNKCFIAYNAGLGDHILMNGAVRHFAKIYEEVHVMVFSKNVINIQHMFRDDPKIHLHSIPQPNGAPQSNKKVRRLRKMFAQAGCDNKTFYWGYTNDWPRCLERVGLDPNKNCWCEGFYRALGVDYDERYKSWKFVRDHEREDLLCKRLGLPDKYLFVVNRFGNRKRNQGFRLNVDRISPHHIDLPQVNPAYLTNETLIFDWMKVIENATEIHVVDTSWLHLVKNMLLKQPKFLYRIARHVPASDANYLNDKYNTGWTDVRR